MSQLIYILYYLKMAIKKLVKTAVKNSRAGRVAWALKWAAKKAAWANLAWAIKRTDRLYDAYDTYNGGSKTKYKVINGDKGDSTSRYLAKKAWNALKYESFSDKVYRKLGGNSDKIYKKMWY